jgi:hypothetical protein
MLRLAKEHNVNPANVEKVDMGGNSAMMAALIHHRPECTAGEIQYGVLRGGISAALTA